MTTIRRIYAYLLALAGLSMFAVASANLGQLLIDVLLRSALTATPDYVRETASFNIAAALVGLPVWLAHWLWLERLVGRSSLERASTLRRLYLYVVLAVWVLELAHSTHSLILDVVSSPGDVRRLGDAVRELPFVVVSCLVWLMHWRVAARDRSLVGEQGGSATLRRWYVYGIAFVGLVTLLVGASGLVEYVWRLATQAVDIASDAALAGPTATTLVGLGLWLMHWRVLPARRVGPDAVVREDGVAVLRSAYLFLALSIGVVGTLFGASQLLYYAVARLLGVSQPDGVGGNILQAAAEPASIALVYGVAWAYQRAAVRHQAAAFEEAPRQAGVRRLYTYLVALISLGTLAAGVTGLLWTFGDLVFNTSAAQTGDGWREKVALFATLAVVGLPVWLLHWRARPAREAEAEVHSLARRLYLYLALIGAMLSLVGSAAAALYRILNMLLGGSSGADVVTDLTHAFAVAVVAAVVATYHWRILRADAPAPEVVATIAPAEATVQIRAKSAAALEQALAALRSTGVDVAVQ
jgi:hypothetical protein